MVLKDQGGLGSHGLWSSITHFKTSHSALGYKVHDGDVQLLLFASALLSFYAPLSVYMVSLLCSDATPLLDRLL